jgi:hypothetical protein
MNAIRPRGATAAAVIRDRAMREGTEGAVRNRKIVEMGLIKVAQAIAEGKVKPTMTDLDRLIRLEEFLRDEEKAEGTKIILEWCQCDGKAQKVGEVEDAGSDNTEEED